MQCDKTEGVVYFDNNSIEYDGKKSTYEIIKKRGSCYDINFTLPSGKTSSIINFSSADVKLFCSSNEYTSGSMSSKEPEPEQIYRDIVVSALMVRLEIMSVYKKIIWITALICVGIGIAYFLYYRNRKTLLIQ